MAKKVEWNKLPELPWINVLTHISHVRVVWHCLMYVSIDSQVLALTQKLDKVGETLSFIFYFLCRYLVTFSPLVDNPDDPQVLQHFGVFHFHKIFHTSPVPFKPCLFCSVCVWRNHVWQQNLAMFSKETCQFVIVFIIDLLLFINYLVDFNKIKSIILLSSSAHFSVCHHNT